jgi:opacity protein-like surface antigen
VADRLGALAAILMLIAGMTAMHAQGGSEHGAAAGSRIETSSQAGVEQRGGREVVVGGYLAQPYYYRSNVRLQRNDGTDIDLKRMGWDGDMLYPPIDGGVRSVHWYGSTGFMIDFLHNKAVSRLGKGAHGSRRGGRPIETVATSGTLGGKSAPPQLKLTDLFERFEFTHGHNVLILTGMARLGAITPRVRPYLGAGAGFALPHVEVWFADEKRENRTNEYQFAGPAAQLVAGLELRVGRMSYYLEYKFSWAWISGALTGDESWKNFNMPGDLLRQLQRWLRGDEPRYGRFSTRLSAHQAVIGAGYVLPTRSSATVR